MSDVLALPPRPNIERYRKLAKEFRRVCNNAEPGAIRAWAQNGPKLLRATGDLPKHLNFEEKSR